MTAHPDIAKAKELILELRTIILKRTLTIKVGQPAGRTEISQAMHEARLLGMLAIRALDEFEFAIETHRIVCICKEEE